MKPGDIVEVRWVDHTFHEGRYGGKGRETFRTVGYFVAQDDDEFKLAMSTDAGPEFDPHETLVIDKRTMVGKARRVRGA